MDDQKIYAIKKQLNEWNLWSSQQVMQKTLLNNIHEQTMLARLMYVMGITFCCLGFVMEPLLGLPRSPQYGIILGLFVVISICELAQQKSVFSMARDFFAKRKFKKLGLDPDALHNAQDLEHIIKTSKIRDDYHCLDEAQIQALHEQVVACNSEWISKVWKQWLASDQPVRGRDHNVLQSAIDMALTHQKAHIETSQLPIKKKLLNEVSTEVLIEDTPDEIKMGYQKFQRTHKV